LASVGFPAGIVDTIQEHTDTAPCLTNGRWFYIALDPAAENTFLTDEKLWKPGTETSWQRAWHGTSLHCLPKIQTMGLMAGPNSVEEDPLGGQPDAYVYCEGEARKKYAFMYSTHVAIPRLNPCWYFGCLLELVVDRARGDEVHGQWQQEKKSVYRTGIWIHVGDIRKAYDPGFLGTMRIHGPQYRLGLRGLRKGHSLRDAMEYKKADLEAKLKGEQADYNLISSLPPT
jgi:hypothetical protein